MQIRYFLFILAGLFLFQFPALAADPVMSAEQQACNTTADCTFVSMTCGNPCASIPINLDAKKALEPTLRNQCGGTLPEETDMICHMNPPLQAACINKRCTVGYAFENNAGSGDYQTSPKPENAPLKPE